MCYEKSVNIFEQNMRERESSLGKNYNARLWKGVAARIARQKAPVIKENAKYSFVELGKLNTSLYTRRILKRFRRLHRQCPHSLVLLQFEPFSVASALILLFPLHDHHSWPTRILYNHRKGRQLSSSPLCSVAISLSLDLCTIVQTPSRPSPSQPCHKNSIHCFKPFPWAPIVPPWDFSPFPLCVCVCSPFQQLSAVDVFCSSSQSRCL